MFVAYRGLPGLPSKKIPIVGLYLKRPTATQPTPARLPLPESIKSTQSITRHPKQQDSTRWDRDFQASLPRSDRLSHFLIPVPISPYPHSIPISIHGYPILRFSDGLPDIPIAEEGYNYPIHPSSSRPSPACASLTGSPSEGR